VFLLYFYAELLDWNGTFVEFVVDHKSEESHLVRVVVQELENACAIEVQDFYVELVIQFFVFVVTAVDAGETAGLAGDDFVRLEGPSLSAIQEQTLVRVVHDTLADRLLFELQLRNLERVDRSHVRSVSQVQFNNFLYVLDVFYVDYLFLCGVHDLRVVRGLMGGILHHLLDYGVRLKLPLELALGLEIVAGGCVLASGFVDHVDDVRLLRVAVGLTVSVHFHVLFHLFVCTTILIVKFGVVVCLVFGTFAAGAAFILEFDAMQLDEVVLDNDLLLAHGVLVVVFLDYLDQILAQKHFLLLRICVVEW